MQNQSKSGWLRHRCYVIFKTKSLCNQHLNLRRHFFFFSFQQLAGNLDDFRIAKTEQKTDWLTKTIERIISNQSYGWVKLQQRTSLRYCKLSCHDKQQKMPHFTANTKRKYNNAIVLINRLSLCWLTCLSCCKEMPGSFLAWSKNCWQDKDQNKSKLTTSGQKSITVPRIDSTVISVN